MGLVAIAYTVKKGVANTNFISFRINNVRYVSGVNLVRLLIS